jgi:hypothetical protein
LQGLIAIDPLKMGHDSFLLLRPYFDASFFLN